MSSPARSSSAVAPQVAGEGTESTAAPSKPDETEAGSVTPCADTAEAAAVEKLQSKVSHANDGSFLEKFKRMKAEKEKKRKEKEAAEAAEKAAEDQRMKVRGGRHSLQGVCFLRNKPAGVAQTSGDERIAR